MYCSSTVEVVRPPSLCPEPGIISTVRCRNRYDYTNPDHSTTRFYAVLGVTQAEMDPGSEDSYTIPLADRLLTSTIN
jgi:hypothetical protein